MKTKSILILRYEGSWEEGIKAGTGKFTYANGDVFTVSREDPWPGFDETETVSRVRTWGETDTARASW